jgi:hypothetical protein
MIGYQITKANLDSRVGTLGVDLRRWCDSVEAMQSGVTAAIANSSTFLADLGYSETDATTILSVMTQMVTVKNAITGQGTIPTAGNYQALFAQATGID